MTVFVDALVAHPPPKDGQTRCIRAARARAVADPFERAAFFPDVPFQPGDGDRNERAMRRLRGCGGPLPEDREPDVVELMERGR